MTRRKRLTNNQVAALATKAKRYSVLDPELAGHYVRVMPSGAKSYAAVARDPYGKQIWFTIGNTDVLKIEESRELAREAIKRIKQGLPPKEPTPVRPDSYQSVSENWIKRHVKAKKVALTKRDRAHPEQICFPALGLSRFRRDQAQ
jgi:Arm DNA-binding domain